MLAMLPQFSRPAALAALVLAPLVAPAQIKAPELEVTSTNHLGWVQLRSVGQTGLVYTVQASTNLLEWQPIATAHEAVRNLADPATGSTPYRFYRLQARAKTNSDDWKNQIHLPNDSFLSAPGESIGPDFRWVKFAIPFVEPFRVYYQDSRAYEFHYEFAKQRLDPFRGMTPAEFDQVALRTNQQQILLGAILIPPYPTESEYGIQFVGLDPYPPDLMRHYFEVVRSTVSSDSNITAFYVPAYEQASIAETNRSYFAAHGIQVAAADRWLVGDDVYSTGWAIGRLKFFPGTDIADAFTDGRLSPQDILLTDGVPAEIPVLAGVLTLTPSTPNSHVAILSKSFGLPFAYLSDPAQRTAVQGLVGKDILLRLDPFFGTTIQVVELEATMDPALRAEILNLKAPPKLEITPKAKYGQLSASTDQLTPADIKFFGGKASNFGFLRRQIPDRSPTAIGISFDLWDEFLDQVLSSGKSLRTEISDRLADYTYPPDVAALRQDLAEIRHLITRTASFTPAQQQAILEALDGFSTTRNVRFRSSTNVEDSEQFTGAGLYDSYSGCIADDLDGDQTGPSVCDPTEEDERGVFRAIQKVYASFYNDNAFIERLRYDLEESQVGMALLVHYSAPDETELANGVATVQVNRGGARDSESVNGDLVTQKGAVSVTNPDGTAKPEVVQGYHHPFGSGGFLRQRSSLVPLGAYVMEWDADYKELMQLIAKVADGYHAYFPDKKEFTLDLEYKKVVPGVLDIKQVREVPVSSPTNTWPSFLVHETNQYWVLQGEAADVFSNHRLKSLWAFHTRNTKLAPSNLLESLFVNVQGTYLDGTNTDQIAGAPATFPGASHRVEENTMVDAWTVGEGANRREFELRVRPKGETLPGPAPVLTLRDFYLELRARYATPQPVLEWDVDGHKQAMVTSHSVMLEPKRNPATAKFLQERTATSGDVKVQTTFYWPAPPGRGIADKTAPLAQWKETRIEGLTSQPIVLRGEFSQTYRPGHHNFAEEFIFEPALEPGMSPAVLEELRAANVQFIHVLFNFEVNQIRILGLDGQFRALPSEPVPPTEPGREPGIGNPR